MGPVVAARIAAAGNKNTPSWSTSAIRRKRSLNNMEMVGADPSKIEALIVSHGHFDHYGGLIGFLDKHRSALPADLTLYAGGEDNFCRALQRSARASIVRIRRARPARARGAQGQDRAVRNPGGRRSRLHHRQNQTQQHREGAAQFTLVEFAMKDGLGCNAGHYLPAELWARSCRTSTSTSTPPASI